MKKLRLSNIFHWLYAFLMFLPFFFIIFTLFSNFGTGNNDLSNVFSSVGYAFVAPDGDTIGRAIEDVYDYVVYDLLGYTDSEGVLNILPSYLGYWTSVSFAYLIFDVLMFPINLAHRWIDKGGIE